MSTSIFSIREHIVPCSHIRQYHRATYSGKEARLRLAVKQYTPHDNPDPQEGDITILGAHANGFPKELYEPLWDALHADLASRGVRIRSIWISDAAWQGYSSELNEQVLGNDPHWIDHSRDLFLLTNAFPTSFCRPIIGIGHSMGGNQLTNLALMHPRLLHSLVLLDPVIARVAGPGNWLPAQASARRRDVWPSRAAAAETSSTSRFYQTWDKRVLELWVQHGLRDLPTALHRQDVMIKGPEGSEEGSCRPVTLRTTKHNEVFSFMRPNLATDSFPDPACHPNPRTHPDVPVDAAFPATPFYRPEPSETFDRLPFVRPSVLYVFGETSPLSTPLLRADKLSVTGTGSGGNGGMKIGRTKGVTVDAGHLVAMERVGECAAHAAEWVEAEVRRWKEEEAEWEGEVAGTEPGERQVMDARFMEAVNGDWIRKALGGAKL